MNSSSLKVHFVPDAPNCRHGPCLLFEDPAKQEKFFACSACRDRQDCQIYISYSELTTDRAKKKYQKQYLAFKKQIQQLQTSLKSSPCQLQPLENKRSDAQYFFSKNFINYFTAKFIQIESWDGILCIGCPTIFENLPSTCQKKFLLDYDHRFCSFYSNEQMLAYNMFNGHCFSNDEYFQKNFLKTIRTCLVVIDPPFGGFHRALAHSLEQLIPSNIQRNLVLFNPYFLEKWIQDAFQGLQMLDYKIEYETNSKMNLCKGKKGSPVRMFTDICPSKCPPLDEDNYKYCFECNRYTLLANQHCYECRMCTSKDGGNYRHCSSCQRCVKADRQHCQQCSSCHLPEQCLKDKKRLLSDQISMNNKRKK